MNRKRAREEQLVDPATGRLLRGDELFSDKDRLILILRQATYKTVGMFESASNRATTFVRNQNIWKSLFKRDFPAIHAKVADPNHTDLLQAKYRGLIDEYSVQQPGDPITYWKRYYEFIIKMKDYVSRRFKEDYWEKYPDEKFDLWGHSTIQLTAFVDDPVFGPRDREESWIMRRAPASDFVYFYPERTVPPDQVVRIDLLYKMTELVDWFPQIETFEQLEDKSFLSLDGFHIFEVVNYDNMLRIDIEGYGVHGDRFLVSQPIACTACGDTLAPLSKCICCKKIFCGEKCQAETHGKKK